MSTDYKVFRGKACPDWLITSLHTDQIGTVGKSFLLFTNDKGKPEVCEREKRGIHSDMVEKDLLLSAIKEIQSRLGNVQNYSGDYFVEEQNARRSLEHIFMGQPSMRKIANQISSSSNNISLQTEIKKIADAERW
jgi:hypothetical protein